MISGLRLHGPIAHDVISFCHHVLLFVSEEAGEQRIADRDDHFLHTLEQGSSSCGGCGQPSTPPRSEQPR